MDIFPLFKRPQPQFFLPSIKETPHDWALVDVTCDSDLLDTISTTRFAVLIAEMFCTFDGHIYICNERELMVVIHCKSPRHAEKIPANILGCLPPKFCRADTTIIQSDYLFQAHMILTPPHLDQKGSGLYHERLNRQDNIYLIADSDTYMREVISHGIGASGMAIEIGSADAILETYRRHNPDVVFLDNLLNAQESLKQLLLLDPNAYIIIIGANASVNNVEQALAAGAKGFLVKPFNETRLIDFIKKCPTAYFV